MCYTKQRIEQFTEFYYNTFDTSRQNLSSLYVCEPSCKQPPSYSLIRISEKREQSMLTFETAAVQGVTGIIEKLTVYEDPLSLTSELIY